MDWNKTIFLAHAKEDKSTVREIYHRLKAAGLEPWFDEENLFPGDQWDRKAQQAIKKSRFFMACISSNSISKNGYIQKELRLALSELELKSPDHIYFIPALIEDIELPDLRVSTVNMRDLHAAKIYEEEQFNRLIRHLQEQVGLDSPIVEAEETEYSDPKSALQNGETETALELLTEQVKGHSRDLQNSVTLLAARYNRLKAEKKEKLINPEQYEIQSNRINYGLLSIVEMLEQENTK